VAALLNYGTCYSKVENSLRYGNPITHDAPPSTTISKPAPVYRGHCKKLALTEVTEPRRIHSPPHHHNELGAEKILYSRRQRRLGLSMLEAASYQCLRCHACMEGKFPSRRSVWHILQVSLASIFFGFGPRQHLTQNWQIKTLRQRTIQTPLRYSLLAP
jgi:hypothetical protein